MTTEVAKVASAATYGGSGAAIFFGLSASEFAAVGGLLIAVCGLLVNIYFKHQHLKIARASVKPDEEK